MIEYNDENDTEGIRCDEAEIYEFIREELPESRQTQLLEQYRQSKSFQLRVDQITEAHQDKIFGSNNETDAIVDELRGIFQVEEREKTTAPSWLDDLGIIQKIINKTI